MKALSPHREAVRLHIGDDVKRRLDGYCEKSGRMQVVVASRAIDWFLRQSPHVQGMVMGDIPTPDAALEKLLAERWEKMQ
jgi:hypothetical protein